jgi:hypothetical protein
MLPLELLNFVLEPVPGAFGGACAEAEGGEVRAVTVDRGAVNAPLGGEAVGEGGDSGVLQFLGLLLILQEALGRCKFCSEGGRAGFHLAELLSLSFNDKVTLGDVLEQYITARGASSGPCCLVWVPSRWGGLSRGRAAEGIDNLGVVGGVDSARAGAGHDEGIRCLPRKISSRG